MVETHSDWIEDGETYEKTLKCPRCRRQVAFAVPFFKRVKFLKIRRRSLHYIKLQKIRRNYRILGNKSN